jgi:Heterokaryon incompatibility protein (HET)
MLPPSPVRCLMKRISANDGPAYTALSYAWGDSNDRRVVLVIENQVIVTTSLESALYHLRHTSDVITLWVDALCINQSDHEEKIEAVQQMKRIYQDATQAIVWLGPSGEDSDTALEVMNEIGKESYDIGSQEAQREGRLEGSSNDNGPYAVAHRLVKEKLSLDLPFEAIARLAY